MGGDRQSDAAGLVREGVVAGSGRVMPVDLPVARRGAGVEDGSWQVAQERANVYALLETVADEAPARHRDWQPLDQAPADPSVALRSEGRP